ncbi:MAG: hypothetical protein ACI9D5_002021 [Candidatus Endobugula sp.]|jgi:hypothetical protein
MQVGGIEPKLSQLKDKGLNEEGIESYRALMSPLFNRTRENKGFRISFAKTGSAFNDFTLPHSNGLRQHIYLSNPRKTTLGVNLKLIKRQG